MSSRAPSPPWVVFGGELAGLDEARRFALAERLLLEGEQQARLLDRALPLNFREERARLLAALLAERPLLPRFRYAAAPDLALLARGLREAATVLAGSGALGELFAGRAEELALEAELASAVGARDFSALAARRFPAPTAAEAAALDALVSAWLAEPRDVQQAGERVAAGDERHPHSLINVLRARVGRRRRARRRELRAGRAAGAAAGDGFVALRPDVELSARDAERIALHELFAHVLPRIAARRERLAVFRTGTRGASDDEEGRALLLEERAGFLQGERRRELALRHVAALAVREGASLHEVVVRLCAAGERGERALDLALRAQRGGGLGREVVYLPAYLRLRAAFSRQPQLERYFERGRVSLSALGALERHAAASSSNSGA